MTNVLYDALFGKFKNADTTFIKTIDGKNISHEGFLAMSARFANALTSLGVSKGDRIAVQVEKSVEAICIYAACTQAGLVFLPLNTAYTASEISYFVEDSGAKFFICDDKNKSQMLVVARTANARLETLNDDGTGSLIDLAKTFPSTFETVQTDGDDLAAFLYTSGTTGRSKGAMLTQNNLLSNALTLTDYWQFTAKDVLIHALPIYHTHGLFVAINVCLISGASIILLPKFNIEDIITNIPNATCFMGVPTFYTRLLSEPSFDKNLVKDMRLFISGSAPLLAETHVEFEERTNSRILERYGMTETNMNTSNPYDGVRRAGTVGFPLPGVELRIVDPETGVAQKAGDIGMIEVRGPNVFKGYWKMPEKTKAEFKDDGFFITGDLGLQDKDGYVQIIGRGKDLIISGGFNIYPKEIELLLDDQDGVSESAVVGIPHPDFGETPLGVLVKKPNQEPDIAAIKANIKVEIARFKHPRDLIVVDELPRNTMGKVQKNILRETYKNMYSL
jgi:malonyl-CoA/methylmalonyl-CoA synthetase